MEDTTTTDHVDYEAAGVEVLNGMPVDEQGNALTEEQVQSLTQPAPPTEAADVTPVDNSTVQPQVEPTNVDPDLINWAKKKGGFETENLSPTELKALQLARDTERTYHDNQARQSELRRQMEQAQAYQQYQQPVPQPYQPPVQPQQQYDEYGQPVAYQPPVQQAPQAPSLDPSLEMLKFQVNHRDYEQGSSLDLEMGRVVSANPVFWASHLEEAYNIAKANLSSSDVEARIEAARREERERLTRKSAASQPQAQATAAPTTSTGFSTPKQAEDFIASASKEDYNARLPELEKALGMELRPRR